MADYSNLLYESHSVEYGYIINLDDIKSIKVSKDYKYRTFIIDIICENNRIQIKSWSTGFLGFHLMFNNNKVQINRLEYFCKKCNQYLEKTSNM